MKPEQRRRVSDLPAQFSTTIGVAAVFKGKLTGEGSYKVYGTVYGDSEIKGTLVLHETGYWEGSIFATNVVICGTVDGDIVAKDKLELAPTAKINGNVMGGVVAIADGAVFEGEIHITKKESIKFFNERRNGHRPEKGAMDIPEDLLDKVKDSSK
jgi:cytoskeletal protein CcmA (bactofilin family)